MKKIQVTTTAKGQKIELLISPKNPARGLMLVNDKWTDASFQNDENIEQITFAITSSSPITNEAEAETIAKKVLEILS